MISNDNGFQDVVIIVGDAAATARRLHAALGYVTIAHGPVEPSILDVLGIATDWAAQEILIGDPAQKRGYMRLIEFPDRKLPVKRDGCQAWDTGGIFDFNIRCLQSLDDVQAEMTHHGFVGHSPVVHWQFGPLDVKEVVLRDSDGLCIAFMERLSPPLMGFEGVASPVSYVFNSTQVVRDFVAARQFYVDILGWQVVQETCMRHESGDNCMGLPLDVARECDVQIGIYHPHGKMEGSVEIIQFGVEGRDYAGAAAASRGIAALRFPVGDPQAILAKAEQAGCTIIALRETHIAPYGRVMLGGLITPWGARLEFFAAL